MFCRRALWLLALPRKETCNWARGKRRGFSPGAAARHRGRTRAPTDCWSQSPLSPPFSARSDVSDVRFEIWHSCQIWSQISKKGNVWSQKSWKRDWKGNGNNTWELWSNPCGAKLATKLKPLRLPRAQAFYASSQPCRTRHVGCVHVWHDLFV